MSKAIRKCLSFALALILIFGCVYISALAENEEISRVNCSIYADGAYGRGFCWSTKTKSASNVQIVKKADFDEDFSKAVTYSGSASLYRSRYSHKVAITDLEAGTEYIYRVGDASKDLWSENGKFITDDKDDSFSFITIADIQADSDEAFEISNLTAEAALKTMPEAEFSVCLGDYVNNNTNEEWDSYFNYFKNYNYSITQVPVAGNHDSSITNKLNTFCFNNMFCVDESRNQFLDGVYYSFDYGNAHFAVLNTNDMFPMSQAQRNWLINDMSNSNAEWKIILAHRSLYSAGKNINKPDTIIMRKVLIPIIDELGIDMFYAGHDHMYLRTAPVYADERADVTYITENYNGQDTVFALNPKGTIYTLPSTAGTKRYPVNKNAVSPILDVADSVFSTKEMGGCFCTTEIYGDKLIYKAYVVDDTTQEVTKVDEFAIKKTEKKECIEPTSLDESFTEALYKLPKNFMSAIAEMIISYIFLLIDMI